MIVSNIAKKETAKRKEHLSAIQSAAKECLSNELFLRYKRLYDAYEVECTDNLLKHPVNDPRYNEVVIKRLAELNVLRKLKRDVEKDARAN